MLLAIVVTSGLLAHRLDTGRELRSTIVATETLRADIEDLDVRLAQAQKERAALPASERGYGPGGLRSPGERWFFEGPTAAAAALDLITAADRAGFRGLSYEGEDAEVVAQFPPESPDAAGSGLTRGQVSLVQWPVRVSMEATYASAMEFTQRLAAAEPAFAVNALRLEVATDSRGEVQDRVRITGVLASHWLRKGEEALGQ